MLQEFILRKKCLFFSFLNALGNVIQQECSQELLVAKGRMGSSRGLHAQLPSLCPASRDRLFGLCLPGGPIPGPQTLPRALREVGPARPHGSTSSCPTAAGHNSSGGRKEGAEAWRGTSCSRSHSCCRGSRFRVLLAVPVASSTSSSGQSYKKCWKSQPCGVSSFKLAFNSVPMQFTFPEHQSPQSDTGRSRASPTNPTGSCAPLPCPPRGGWTPSLTAAGSLGWLSPHMLAHRADPASARVRSVMCFGNGLALCGGSGLWLGLLNSRTSILGRMMHLRWGCESKGRKS